MYIAILWRFEGNCEISFESASHWDRLSVAFFIGRSMICPDRRSTGVAQNINNGSLLCGRNPWHTEWAELDLVKSARWAVFCQKDSAINLCFLFNLKEDFHHYFLNSIYCWLSNQPSVISSSLSFCIVAIWHFACSFLCSALWFLSKIISFGS